MALLRQLEQPPLWRYPPHCITTSPFHLVWHFNVRRRDTEVLTDVQVNSETDFATKTEQFRSLVSTVAAAALRSPAAGAQHHA